MRSGFKKIVVGETEYEYSVSLKTGKLILYKDIKKYEFPLELLQPTITWRGKNKDGSYGKKEVAAIINKNVGYIK